MTTSYLERYKIALPALHTLALPAVSQTFHRDTEKERLMQTLAKGDPALLRCWRNPFNHAAITVSVTPEGENIFEGFGGLHVSFAHPSRLPTWDELKACKLATFGPDLEAFQVFPRQEIWYSAHPFCLHLWELPFRWEARTA